MADEKDSDILKYISEIDDLTDMFKLLESEEMDNALYYVVKLTQQPAIPAGQAAILINRLQAISAMAQWRATYYTYINKSAAGSMEYKKKNAYYALSDSLDKVVAALKYSIK